MKFDFEWKEDLTTAAGHRKLMWRLNDETARKHKYITLPGHFREGANRKYHYHRRSQKYLKWKHNRYGTDRPDLVLTGELKGVVLVKSKYTRTYKGWRIYVKAPFPMRDEMRAEIEKILIKEKRQYRDDMAKQYMSLASHAPYARRRRAKIKG